MLAPSPELAVARTAPVAVAVEGVSLSYVTREGPVQALSGVDLSIERGEFVSLIGPSGCGKTTLLRAVADLEEPTSGAILPGADADLVVWDPKAKKTITAKNQVSAIDYNVFEGKSVEGLPRFTLSRGDVVFNDG